MKKSISVFLMVILFVTAIFAGEGDLPNGGRSCQSNCLVSSDMETNYDSMSLLNFVESSIRNLFN